LKEVHKIFRALLRVTAYTSEIRGDFYFKMNTTTYVRFPRNNEHPFTRISNSIAKLPAVEAGIMLQILSNSDDWVINKEVVRKRSGLGKDRFKKAWNHLKTLGYISIKQIPSQNGKIQYEYTIYENPEVQNPPTEIETPCEDNRSTETHTTVNHITETGITNNYQEINEDQIITTSGSNGLVTEWRVRPGEYITGPNMLGQVNINEDNLQIVPNPPLCFGGVRNNKEGHKEDLKEIDSQLEEPSEIISSEEWYPEHINISDEEKEVIEDLENLSLDFLKEMLDAEYLDTLPNWEDLLKNKFQSTHTFLKETSKLHKPDIVAIETLTEFNNRIKKDKY